MSLPSPYVAVPNPYRPLSQLAGIWRAMQSGLLHTLGRLEFQLHGSPIPGSVSEDTLTRVRRNRRRCIASALRTIRRQPNGVDIVYNKASKTYQMVEVLS